MEDQLGRPIGTNRRQPESCNLTYRGYAEPQNLPEVQYEMYGIDVAISKLQYRKRQLMQLAADLLAVEAAKKEAAKNATTKPAAPQTKSVDPEEAVVTTEKE